MTQIALVTGGARRIGAEIVNYLHKKNFIVWIHHYTSVEETINLCNKLNARRADSAFYIQADLRDPKQQQSLVNHIETHSSKLDLLVNNASVFFNDDHHAASTQWLINAKAPYELSLLCQKLLKLSNDKANIVNISDRHATRPLKDYHHYSASKAALNLYSKALAKQFAPDIRVNVISPGAILWPEGKNLLSKEQQSKIIDQTLLKQHGSPMDIAKAVYYLNDLSFVTGENLLIDGGRSNT